MAKQKHVTDKKQLAQVAEQVEKIKGQRSLAKDRLYPALVAATVSVDEAKMLLQSISSLVMEDALQVLRDKKMSEVKDSLVKRLCPDGERVKEVGSLLDVLNDETLFDTKAQVEGMANVIDFMIRKEMQDRTLNSFTPDWESMMAR
jgi:hypothetical protein